MRPKVSVIIPTYNVAPYIGRAIRSALSQTLQDIEVIVVDDRSQDGTVETVTAFGDPRMHVIVNKENRGPSYSRNRAIAVAQGEWIAVLDGDDWWNSRRLEVLVQEGERLQADIVCDDLFLIVEGHAKPWSTFFKERRIPVDRVRGTSIEEVVEKDLGPLHPLIRREFLVQSGIQYREELRYGEDFMFLLECMLRGARMVLVPNAMYYYVSRPGSLITDKIRLYENTLAAMWQMKNEVQTAGRNDLLPALHRREERLRKSLLYYRVVQPLKAGRYGAALTFAVRHPSFFAVLAEAVPRSLRYRLLRWRAQ